MKTKYYYLAAMAVLGLTACSNDDSVSPRTDKQAKGAVFAGGNTEVNSDAQGTRTSANYDRNAHTLTFFWEPNDKIFLADGNSGSTNITTKQARASFYFETGTYTNPTYDVYYTGTNGTSYNTVNIATTQTQNAPNTTSHFGQAGDCGTAQATQQPNGNYKFDLTHRSSYLCFLPRTTGAAGTNWVMTQVKVTSDNNIAGDYTLTTTGLTGTGSSNTITLNTNNFDVTNSETSQPTNAAYMVIAPGAHSLTVEYTVRNTVTNETATINKTLKANKNYVANTVYPITAMLFTDYTSQLYYQWDAPHDMWYGKVPLDATIGLYNVSDAPSITTYPSLTINDPNRVAAAQHGEYTSTEFQYTLSGNSNSVWMLTARATAANNPTVQEMVWFRDKGDAHWDNNAVWTFRGKMYKGGMWIKKPNIIASENSTTVEAMKTTFPNPLTWQFEMHGGGHNSITQGTPTNTANYFFLPALGSYEGAEQSSSVLQMIGGVDPQETDMYTYGHHDASWKVNKRQILGLGKSGIYFSSSSNREGPFCLTFSKSFIAVGSYGGYISYNMPGTSFGFYGMNIGAINMSSIVNF